MQHISVNANDIFELNSSALNGGAWCLFHKNRAYVVVVNISNFASFELSRFLKLWNLCLAKMIS